MRNLTYLLASIGALAMSGAAQAAVSFGSTDFGFAAPAGADVVVDFENGLLPAGFTRTGGLVRTVDDGLGAQPAIAPNVKATSFYLSANANDTATISSATGYREVSLYWGSIDSYNRISLLDQTGTAFASYTGLQINPPADGNQGAANTNRRVSFTTDGSTSAIYGLRFESTQPAFEVDNIAFSAAVPEPASWAMMIGGFGVVGGAMRRRRSTMFSGSRAIA